MPVGYVAMSAVFIVARWYSRQHLAAIGTELWLKDREGMMKLCLTIGVSRAPPLSHLPGAITVAHEMMDWANKSGFVTKTITDESNVPVTIDRIRQALLEILPQNEDVELFILHFAGHGFRTGAEQNVWLPSDWFSEMRAISVEALKRQLYRHGIRNLSIISDACRSLPSDIETADICPDPVLPRGPYDPVPPIIDRFSAGLDGQQAYMLKGDANAPARCIFSTVLLEGLYGLRQEAFDKHEPDFVIAESLALFSMARLKEIGEAYDLKCSPDNNTGIPRDHAVYYQRGSISPDTATLKWPAPLSQNKKQDDIELYADLSNTRYRGLHQHFRDSKKHFHENGFLNLIIQGAVPKNIWSTHQVEILSFDDDKQAYRVEGTIGSAIQVLVEFFDGVFASAVVYENLITLMSRDKQGETSWTCVVEWAHHVRSTGDFLHAIANLQSGSISAEQADHIAARMRAEKHFNPTLGAIASYLYDYTGDINSIRRMAFFYCSRRQPVPFDVAFMGLLSTHDIGRGRMVADVPRVPARSHSAAENLQNWVTCQTNETSGEIAGLWPWLRQGWQFMENPEKQEKAAAEGLCDVANFLLPSQFSSFKEEGARILICKFKLEAYECTF